MKYFEWDKKKNEKLKKERKISFEQVIKSIIEGSLIDIIENPSSFHKNQRVFVLKISNYIYYVPFVEDEEKIFMKTIIPSRKLKNKYLKINKKNYEKK